MFDYKKTQKMLIICQIDWHEVGVAFEMQCFRNCTLSSYNYFAHSRGSYTVSYIVASTVRFENHAIVSSVSLLCAISCSMYCSRFINLFSLIFTNEMRLASTVKPCTRWMASFTGRPVSPGTHTSCFAPLMIADCYVTNGEILHPSQTVTQTYRLPSPLRIMSRVRVRVHCTGG